MKRVVSGVKPTGKLTLGNYIGALKQFPTFQDQYEVFIFIADLHALTMPIEPQVLKSNCRSIAAFYLACGLDPNKTTIFLQSQVSAHAQLNTILQNYLYMGELSRMVQYKEKSQSLNDNAIGLGIFAYPVLMSADILLYNASIVPVGEDQLQHVELCRDLVKRFNNRYGNILVMPKAQMNVGSRIMSLSDPSKKMSKSDAKGDIYLTDSPLEISKKIKSAVTDSLGKIAYDVEKQPGIANLLTIYASLANLDIKTVAHQFSNLQYGQFKQEVINKVVATLSPIQQKYEQLINSSTLDNILNEGAKKAEIIANKTLNRVKEAVGLIV